MINKISLHAVLILWLISKHEIQKWLMLENNFIGRFRWKILYEDFTRNAQKSKYWCHWWRCLNFTQLKLWIGAGIKLMVQRIFLNNQYRRRTFRIQEWSMYTNAHNWFCYMHSCDLCLWCTTNWRLNINLIYKNCYYEKIGC